MVGLPLVYLRFDLFIFATFYGFPQSFLGVGGCAGSPLKMLFDDCYKRLLAFQQSSDFDTDFVNPECETLLLMLTSK